MIETFTLRWPRHSFPWTAYAVSMVVGVLLAAVAYATAPETFGVALGLLVVTIVAWFVSPVTGLALTVFFALVGDLSTSFWWPFTKSMSSRESIMFVSTSVNISPLEITLVAAFAALLLRYLATGIWPFRTGPLLRPLCCFTFFILVGLVYGIAHGGTVRIALIEVRPLLYLPLVYLLVAAVCRSLVDFQRVLWAALAAILAHALISLLYFSTLTNEELGAKESIMEHTAALRMDVLFVVVIVAWLFPGVPRRVRITATLLTPPVILVYLVSQRRAAMVALGAALVLLAVTLFWRQRRTFWRVVPIAAILVTAYVGAFWNSPSSLGAPAQAVKSVISPSSLSARDQSSDIYRQVENYDLNYTIRATKVFGTGFGQPFYRPIALPDISSFELYQYVPHNSILWIWINAGFGGFVSMLYLLARTVMIGSARLRRAPDGMHALILFVAVSFVVMFALFAYVDISWDARNMIMLAFAFAACVHAPIGELRRSKPGPPVRPAQQETPHEQQLVLARAN